MRKKGWVRVVTLLVTAFILLWMHVIALASAPAKALKDVSTIINENRVSYPQLDGMEDAQIQQKINDDIIAKAELVAHLMTLSALQEDGWGLVVEYEAFLHGDVLSVTISAKGEMPTGREGQKYTALCYDLKTGEPITLSQIFTDVDGAVAWMEEKAIDTLTDELSGYLENSDLQPLPTENFALDADGITFYYPSKQFALHSGYAGACQFYYEELSDFLDWEGIPAMIGVENQTYTDAESKEKISELLKTGQLPHVPVQIGDEMTEVVSKYRLLRVPDQYPSGKYYQMEAPMFRQVLVLSDALTSGYDNSQVLGLQSMRGNLFGIQAGETTRERWQEILGQPEGTVVFTESLAYDYGIPQGESDFYTFGDYQLRLHAREDGILHSIRLSK